ncbi:MAG: hypothetical protein P4L69_23875 [Desulfosporosinus sp.]|nr:hypothetical protein [Desulfosporosinus sp.]
MEAIEYHDSVMSAVPVDVVDKLKKLLVLIPATDELARAKRICEARKTLLESERISLETMPYNSTACKHSDTILSAVFWRMKVYLHRKGTDSEFLGDLFIALGNAISSTDEMQKELWLTLLFNISRAFIDPDLGAAIRARCTLNQCEKIKLATITPDQENYLKEAHNFFKFTLTTLAVRTGLQEFLSDIGLPKDKLESAITIGKEMQIKYVTGAMFYGMVGFGKTIYLSFDLNYPDDPTMWQENRALIVINIFHEFGHVLIREMIGSNFGAVTPRGKSSGASALEGGYKMELRIFGAYDRGVYIEPNCNILLDKDRWSKLAPIFTGAELSKIHKFKITNYMFSGICPLCSEPFYK